jgi:hypothetical protein
MISWFSRLSFLFYYRTRKFIINIVATMNSPQRPASEESVSATDEQKLPWKYIGHKVFSRWIASDQTFFVMRRFGALNARVALSLQDEIVELEANLTLWTRRTVVRMHPTLTMALSETMHLKMKTIEAN